MTGKNRWLTPDTAPTGFICRSLFIPADVDWLAIVTGALLPLVYPYNFEAFGTSTPDQTAAEFAVMLDKFALEREPCRVIGEIISFAGSTNPDPVRWLLCDGASLLRTDYPDLFTVIGTAFGAVDGTHFNLPDLQGRTQIGVGSGSGLTPRALGDSIGEETHILVVSETPAHTHIDSGHSHAEGTAIASVGAAITGVPVPSAIPSVGVTGTSSANNSTSGSDGAHNNIQPSLAINAFIVAKD